VGALDGKVAIITGAGTGVGRCHAELFAAEGASVVVNDVSDAAVEVADAITAAGGSAVAHQSDISDWDATGAMVKRTLDEYGDLDIVVNNAGLLRDSMSFSMAEDQWNIVIDVHLKGHAAMAHHAGAYWRAIAKGLGEGDTPRPRRIINTTSESGLFGGPAQMNYASAKGGIITMTMVLAKELGRYGVTVNCIAPRARTQMNEMMERFAKPEEGFDPYDPAHVSPMVAWLASDEASDVNGQTFIVTGDEIHRMAMPTVARAITAGDERWSVDAITANRAELFGDDSPTLPMWAGPAMR
jgi:NAD(P)-dependent dehydrogenase (short-subunit alcohol dehydrogenase family)